MWEVIQVVRDNQGLTEEAAAYLEIDPRLVEVAVRYYGDRREEIDAWIDRVRELNEAEETKRRAAREALSD